MLSSTRFISSTAYRYSYCQSSRLAFRLSASITTTTHQPQLLQSSKAKTHAQPTIRPFSLSSPLAKKKDKGSKGASAKNDSGGSGGSGGGAGEVDPFDFSQLETSIKNAVERLKEDISKLRAGGRMNPDAIEGLKVSLKGKGGGGGKGGDHGSVKLGELAQVISKGGRSFTVLAGEEDHIKPITTAIASSNLSLNPQLDGHNPLQLNVPIPPPTKESREKSVKDAKAAMEKASQAVRNARGSSNKNLKGMKKTVRPDALHKALDQMEKVAEKGQKEVKDVFEAARKALDV